MVSTAKISVMLGTTVSAARMEDCVVCNVLEGVVTVSHIVSPDCALHEAKVAVVWSLSSV